MNVRLRSLSLRGGVMSDQHTLVPQHLVARRVPQADGERVPRPAGVPMAPAERDGEVAEPPCPLSTTGRRESFWLGLAAFSPQEVSSLLLGQHFTAACPATQKPFSFLSAGVPCWIQTQPLATQPLNRPLSPRLTSLPSLKKKKLSRLGRGCPGRYSSARRTRSGSPVALAWASSSAAG